MTKKELNAIKRMHACVKREVWNASEILYSLSFVLEEHDAHDYQRAKLQEVAEKLYSLHKEMQIDWGND